MAKELREGDCPENEKKFIFCSETGKNCSTCKGNCCRYVITSLDKPKKIKDFDEFRWFVAHKNINIFVDGKNDWNLEFLTPCEFLNEENRCEIYDKRPKICRNFSVEDCPHHNEYSEKYTFTSLSELEDYIENVWKKAHPLKNKK